MLQRLLTILLVSFVIHLAGGSAVAAASQKQDASIRLRRCLRVNKPLKQAVKIQNDLSVRARVPLVCKTCSLRTPDASGTSPGMYPCSFNRFASGQERAGSAYVLRLIYPFHFFL